MASTYQTNRAGAGSSGGSGESSNPYVQSVVVGDWNTSPSPDYTLTIAESVHEKGTEPVVTLYEDVGGLFEEVEAYVAIDTTGNITIKVPVSPDGRFTGKIVIN